PALADNADGWWIPAVELIQAKRDKLCGPKAASVGHMQHGTITQTGGCRRIRRIQQRLDFLPAQIRDQGFIRLLHGDAVDLSSLLDTVWLTIFQVPEERLDGRQSGIAGSRCITAMLLD